MEGVPVGLIVKESFPRIMWRYLAHKGLYGEEHSIGEFGFLRINIFSGP